MPFHSILWTSTDKIVLTSARRGMFAERAIHTKGLTIWTLQADYLVLTNPFRNIPRPSASRNMYKLQHEFFVIFKNVTHLTHIQYRMRSY